jgi:hypothetical protein
MFEYNLREQNLFRKSVTLHHNSSIILKAKAHLLRSFQFIRVIIPVPDKPHPINRGAAHNFCPIQTLNLSTSTRSKPTVSRQEPQLAITDHLTTSLLLPAASNPFLIPKPATLHAMRESEDSHISHVDRSHWFLSVFMGAKQT